MKFNYNKYLELNKESVSNNGNTLESFWLIQGCVEQFIREGNLNEQQTELLLDLGVIEREESERKSELLNHKFGQ
jgi:hypothetical protein